MSLGRRCVVLFAMLFTLCGLIGCETPTTQLRDRGIFAYQHRQYDQAQGYLNRVVQRQPQDWVANYYLGELALLEGNYDAARTNLEVAFSQQNEGPPRHPMTYAVVNALAKAIFMQGDYPRVLGLCNEAIANYGRSEDYLRKASFLEQMGDHDKALVAYQTAQHIYPGDPKVYVAMADFYDNLGERDAAVTQLRKAYTLAPQDKAIEERLRSFGVVPGPTILPPVQPDASAP